MAVVGVSCEMRTPPVGGQANGPRVPGNTRGPSCSRPLRAAVPPTADCRTGTRRTGTRRPALPAQPNIPGSYAPAGCRTITLIRLYVLMIAITEISATSSSSV
jgi:hypothetical protein